VSGQRFQIERATDTVFIARPQRGKGVDILGLPSLGLLFEFDRGRWVRKMVVSTNRIRGLEFEPDRN
jgi:hypothetical protein